MTRYAYDAVRRLVVAAWETGAGGVAQTVAEVSAEVDEGTVVALTYALSALSDAGWRTYTHPASAAAEGVEVNTEGWRREADRGAFAVVLPALREPNLPEGGLMVESYVPVEEAAHRVGRVLHEIGDASLVEQVAADVQAELAAVEAAELGDLSGRAQQAVRLTRADASPVQ